MKRAYEIIETDISGLLNIIDFSALENKTILITGASGLLGVHFLTCLGVLQEQGTNVRVVAVVGTGLPSFLDRNKFKDLVVLAGDLSDDGFCRSLPNADFIIHAAGYAQPLRFLKNPEKTLKINTASTFILFEKLNEGGSFLFVSSSEVYTGLPPGVYKESEIGNANTTHPRSCYIEGKKAGEAICNAFRMKGIKAASARLAHTYGPGAKKGDQRVLLALIEKGMQGRIDLLDDGASIRTYCYITDAVELMWRILFSCNEPIYNICGRSETTIADAADLIGHEMNVPVIIPQRRNSVPGAPVEVRLDTTLIANEFNKSHYTDLKEGLRKTISWYLSNN